MNNLTKQLANLYEPKWKELKQQLDAQDIKVQAPFMLGVALEHDHQGGYIDESWWTDADLKVMVFGKEPNIWPIPQLEDGSQVQSDDFIELYQRFYSDNYKGQYFLTDSDNKLAQNNFFNIGFNGIMSGIHEFINNSYPNKRVAYLWNNVSKLSAIGKKHSVSKTIHKLEEKYFHVIPKEIEILKPDILIFLTGPGLDVYYDYIRENFTVMGTPKPLAQHNVNAVSKLNISEVKLAYKTYHPAARITKEEKWDYYHAILDDIKEHIPDIFLKDK